MKLGSSKGAKTGVWFPNEILHVDDINSVGEGTYQNITDMLAALAEQGVATGATKDIVIAGLLLEWNNLLTSDLRAGMAISYSGYYMASDGTWGFQASSGDIFSVLVNADQAVAVDPGGAQARYDTIEIRPVQVQYDSKSRAFKDPVTGLVTSSPVDTKIEYGYEFQVLKGTGGGVAPTHTAGWIKIAEVFVDVSATAITQNDIKDVRNSDLWTTEANDVKYKEAFVGEKVTSSPTGGTATSLSKVTTIKEALVELFARLRNLSGVQNNAVVNRHIGPLAVRQAEIDLGVDAGDVDADVVPLGQVVSSSPTGGTATNLPAASFIRAALQEILNRLKNLSGVGNDSVDSRHYAPNSIDEEHINWGLAAGQVDAAHLPIADAGGKITATQVEGALQENRIAIDVSEADIVIIEAAIAAIQALDPGHTITGDVSGSGSHINLGTASITLTIGDNRVDAEHINWGSASRQVNADDVPVSATKKWLTTVAQTIAGQKSFSSRMDADAGIDVSVGLNYPFLHVQDQRPSNTPGGDFVKDIWQTRILNTVLTNTISGASLSSNRITIPAGTYYIVAYGVVYMVNAHKTKIRRITAAAADLLIGMSGHAASTDAGDGFSVVRGRFSCGGTIAIELQHRCSTTFNTYGVGPQCNFGVVEVYADVQIWKLNS